MTKSERLNLELAFLADKKTFQLKDLMSEFHISKRTALRDISALEALGLPLFSEVGSGGGYQILQHRPLIPVIFNDQEISAIFFALGALKNLTSTPFPQSYVRITDKLLAVLSHDQQKIVKTMQKAIHYYSGGSISKPIFLQDFLAAILQTKLAVIRCPKRFGVQSISIQPLELLYRNGIWFCETAFLMDDSSIKWGTLRIDQIESFIFSEDEAIVARSQLYELQRQYEKNHHDILFRCHLTHQGAERFKKNHYPNMQIRASTDGYELFGGYNSDEYEYMLSYLLSYGTEVTVLEPDELRKGYVKKLNEILNRYSQGEN